MKHLLLLIAALLGGGLAGCAGFGLSAEQINELSQSQSSVCVHAPAWNGSAADLHYTFFGGKSTGTAGGGGKSTCGNSIAEFTNEGRTPAPPKVVQALCESGQAFALVNGELLRTPAEDSRCARPVAIVGGATDAASQAALDQARQAALRGKRGSREDE